MARIDLREQIEGVLYHSDTMLRQIDIADDNAAAYEFRKVVDYLKQANSTLKSILEKPEQPSENGGC